ncbi:unnamed protein product [Arabidopsis lyrata]|nr:unnamed protein product [Arabidopsis lyrata]
MKNWIPIDLIIEILSRLPAKSVARCRCVSKQWRSIIRRQDFTELFLTRSKARPRLLISVQQDGEWSFLSLPQPQNRYENSSLVVAAADFHTKFSAGISLHHCSYVSGLIYFHNMRIPKEDEDEQRVLYDPLTGQYVILPQLRGESDSYLGFDPIDKEFKVLVMNTSYYTAYNDVDHHILTVGTGKLRWRKIQCPFTHEPFWERICINGILYYLALDSDGRYFMVVCFDVRSEKFKLVDIECRFDQLVNYKGKLCGIDLKNAYYGGFPLELRMWVLEDVQKREWSKYVYTLRDDNKVVKVNYNLSVSGMTATGDIVLLLNNASNPYYVSYFNPERNTLQIQSVEIQGLRANCDRMAYYYAFVDYVEDLSVNDAMQLKSSPLQQCQNIVTEKPRQRCYTSRDLSNSAPSVMNDVEDLSVNDAVLQLKSNPLQQCQNIVTKRPKPRHRRHTSRDLSKSSPFVKNKQQNKVYELLFQSNNSF